MSATDRHGRTEPAQSEHPRPEKQARREPSRYVDPVFELEPFPFGD